MILFSPSKSTRQAPQGNSALSIGQCQSATAHILRQVFGYTGTGIQVITRITSGGVVLFQGNK
jgi:hypothetical protein